MIKNKDVVMHAKEFMGITNATSLEKNCEVPGVVTSRSLENLEVLRRCNSFPLYISSNVYCDWRKKSTSTVQNRFISSNSYRQSVNSNDTPTFNYELYNLQPETKSLQELQIEVDALLEFRDLVIETFPDLKNKIISMSSAAISANTSKLHSTPRAQTKKKKLRKDSHSSFSVQGSSVLNTSVIIGEASPAFVSRSRSNSNSCKKEPKSGEGSGSVVQDSGFSTETTSSKDGHSASSTTGVLQGANLPNRNLYETDDELLNLLDVIYRKTSRFRQKFSSMQNYERDKQETYISSASISNILHSSSFNRKVLRYNADNPPKENVLILRKERDKLLDRVAELESEMLEGQIKISDMEKQVQLLTSGNSNLEEQLKIALSQNQELNSKLLQSRSDSPSRIHLQSSSAVTSTRNLTRSVTCKNYTAADQIESFTPRMSSMKDIENQRQQKSALSTCSEPTTSGYHINSDPTTDAKDELNTARTQKYSSDLNIKSIKEDKGIKSLGKLDCILNSPKYLCKVRETDSKKFAAILLETNTLELQRHLLMLTVQNQVLMQKLDEVLKLRQPFGKRFSGSREEMVSYKQQVRKPSMELVETKFKPSKSRSPQNISLHRTETMSNSKSFCNNCVSPANLSTESNIKTEKVDSSQSESCTDCVRNQEIDNNQTSNEYEETFQPPKRSKPSKIPLPGSKTLYSSKTLGYMSSGSSPPFTAIHKSLSYSTGNIFFKNNASKLNRQDSLIMKNRGSSASISTDSKIMSPRNIFITSPLPKIKRDSVTARVRQLDYLTTSRNSGKTSEKTQSDNKTGSSQQLIAQNKLNKIIVSTVVNNSPITSPSRSIKGKKENNISVATKRNIMLRKDTDKSTAAKKLGHSNSSGVQALIGGNNNTNNNSSITNSSVNSSLAIDEQYNDVDIGRVRNLRSALLGWLKI